MSETNEIEEKPTVDENPVPQSASLPEYITVRNGEDEPLEIPIAADNTVLLTTLNSSFPGSTGLKFKNPKTGANRIVQVDQSGSKLLAPPNGWDDTVFQVIVPARESNNGAKRRKMDDGDSVDDGEDVSQKSGETVPVDIIVLGVDYKTKDEGFKTYFEQFGKVVFHELKRKPDGASKGFGFVRMETLEEQNKILSTTNHYIDTRKVEVRIPETKNGSKGERVEKIKRLFVGRLTDKLAEEQLREFFTAEGKKHEDDCHVTDVYIPKPNRGFGFVMLSSAAVASKLAKQENLLIGGQCVTVSLAAPRDDQPKPSYGGGGGYGSGGGGRGGSRNFGPPGGGYEDDYSMISRYGNYMPPHQNGPPGKQWAQPLMSAPTKRPQPRGYGHGSPSSSSPSSSKLPQPLMRMERGGAGGMPTTSRGSGRSARWHDDYYSPASKKSYTQTPPPLPDWSGEADGFQHGFPPPREQPYANIASGLDALNINQKNPQEVFAMLTALMQTMGYQPPQHGYGGPPPGNGPWK